MTGFIGMLPKFTSENGSDDSFVLFKSCDGLLGVRVAVDGTVRVGWTSKDSSRLK